jgi:hypothetical protein
LAKKKALQWAGFRRLGDVQKALNLSLPQAVELVRDVLHEEPYTRAEVCQILDMKEEDFVNNVLSARTAHGTWLIISCQSQTSYKVLSNLVILNSIRQKRTFKISEDLRL